MTEIAFTVYGKSETKGSTKSFVSKRTGAIVTMNDNDRGKGWQHDIGVFASIAMRGKALLTGPLELNATFYLPRPKKLPKRVRWHTTKPDLDKLARCLKDALTNVVWCDDAQVSLMAVQKRYAGWVLDPDGDIGRPRAEILVRAFMEAAR